MELIFVVAVEQTPPGFSTQDAVPVPALRSFAVSIFSRAVVLDMRYPSATFSKALPTPVSNPIGAVAELLL
ncbi:hypothetical protein D3C86_1755700 [compost metagenome]